MDLILQLSDDEMNALRALAEVEGCSVEDVVRAAVRTYLGISSAEQDAEVIAAAEAGAIQYSETLRRLGEYPEDLNGAGR